MNTAFTTYGEYNKENKDCNIYNKRALVDEGKIIDNDLINIDVSNDSNLQKKCYRYFIHNKNKTIFLLSKNGFFIGKVLSFQDCIDNLIKENNWLGAMCLGIDIFQGNITSFPDVPIDKKERYQYLSPYLIELLNKYIDENMKENKDNKETNEEKKNKLIKCMNATIEFCIGIKDINYLLKNVEETFKAKGKIDLFYKLLEPFIFNDLLSQEELSEDSLIALFTTYKGNNELSLLSHLFSHFNIKCLTNSNIRQIALKEHLYSIMILIYSNSKNWEDYFLPVAKMYKEFERKIKQKEIKFKSYMDMCESNSIKDINKIESSTEYIGHKLLWYIDMSLKGNKFSLGMDINLLKFDIKSEEYINFICTLFYWILLDDVFINLMKFDSYSFFDILSGFINEQNIINIIRKYDFNKININLLDKIQEGKESLLLTTNQNEIKNSNEILNKENKIKFERNGKTIDYNNPNSIINNIIINLVEKNKSFFYEIDFSLFLLKYASKCTELNPVIGLARKYIVIGIKKLLTFYEEYEKLKKENPQDIYDVFNCHKLDKYKTESNKIDINNLFFKEINKILRDLLDSQYSLKNEELEDIISICKNSPFVRVKIKLYELSKRYSDCLENYLNQENEEIFEEDVFSWLQKTFQSFSQKNDKLSQSDFDNLQKAFIDKVDILSEKSVDKTNKIVKQFFGSKQKITIIHKLESLPELQYEFLRQLICPSKGGNIEEISKNEIKNENENNTEENNENKNNDSLCDLLLLQIDLLIKLNKKKEILQSIKDQIKIYPQSYPKEKCLEKCLENKINDAAVYLYQLLGKNDSALTLTKEQTEIAFDIYLKELKEESYEYFLQQLYLCINICQYTSESLAKKKLENKNIDIKDGDKLWFDLLKTLYNFEKRCQNKISKKNISKNIEDLLKKMCLHVSIQNIIETVTEIQKDAQYKEFKNILDDMLRSNNSFNRILENTKLILKNSSINYEEERSQSSIRGNCYNNKVCDVCHKNFIKSKREIISCFGCGHQCHEKCAYCSNNVEECIICRRNAIGDEFNFDKKSLDKNSGKKVENEKDKKLFMVDIRKDRIKKLKDFDDKYTKKVLEIF